MLAVANAGSCVGPQNKIGHPAHRYKQLMQVPVLSVCSSQTCVFVGVSSKVVDIILSFREKLMCFMKYEMCCVELVSL